jgi:hypothetical protein
MHHIEVVMIIAIDESGSFGANSTELNFFIAVHIRQRKTLYKSKVYQFTNWEHSLPKSVKRTSKGEIKSSSLSNEQLTEFARNVVCAPHHVGITPWAVNPMDNPAAVVDKHRAVKLTGIRNGVKEYAALGRQDLAKTYDRFGDWLKKLSYNKYIKIIMLHECMSDALVNTIGRAIIGQYDEELLRIRFLIDEDFIRGPDLSLFWHELLRSNFYHASRENPVPILDR